MTTFSIKQDDTLPIMAATLIGDDGNAANLAGATVTLRYQAPGSTATVTGLSVTVLDAAAGVVEYQFTAAQTAAAGIGRAEFVADFGAGDVQTYPPDSYVEIDIAYKL